MFRSAFLHFGGGAAVIIRNVRIYADLRDDGRTAAITAQMNAGGIRVENCAVDGVCLSVPVCGGPVGRADGAAFVNCYVHAEMTAEKSGSLAYYTKKITCENCGYALSKTPVRTNGGKMSADAFSSGEAAYLINCCSGKALFGVENGKTVISENPGEMIRLGSRKVYSSDRLRAGCDLACYITVGGSVVLIQKKNGEVRLVDSGIVLTVKGEERSVPFSAWRLVRYAEDVGKRLIPEKGYVFYLLDLQGAESVKVNGKALPQAAR